MIAQPKMFFRLWLFSNLRPWTLTSDLDRQTTKTGSRSFRPEVVWTHALDQMLSTWTTKVICIEAEDDENMLQQIHQCSCWRKLWPRVSVSAEKNKYVKSHIQYYCNHSRTVYRPIISYTTGALTIPKNHKAS